MRQQQYVVSEQNEQDIRHVEKPTIFNVMYSSFCKAFCGKCHDGSVSSWSFQLDEEDLILQITCSQTALEFSLEFDARCQSREKMGKMLVPQFFLISSTCLHCIRKFTRSRIQGLGAALERTLIDLNSQHAGHLHFVCKEHTLDLARCKINESI